VNGRGGEEKVRGFDSRRKRRQVKKIGGSEKRKIEKDKRKEEE